VSLPDLAVNRPVLITCFFFASIIIGIFCFTKLGVNLYPNVEFPIITVQTEYDGASPEEVEAQISKRIEDAVSGITGVKEVSSKSLNSYSIVTVEFYMGTNLIQAQSDVKAQVDTVIDDFPQNVDTPLIQNFDINDQPILQVALTADLTSAELYDLANLDISHRFEQINNVAQVKLAGGREREIHVLLDREKLNKRQLFVTAVSQQLDYSGKNVPIGKVNKGKNEIQFRSTATFTDLQSIRDTVINFQSNDFPVKISDLGEVKEGLATEQTRSLVNGKTAILFQIYRASNANTVQLSKEVIKAIAKIQKDISGQKGSPKLELVMNTATAIEDNVSDVYSSIRIGIYLTILVVFLFLASLRSTFITVLAVPNSFIGAFTFMYLFGDSINVMTLLALSLTVGLLIDDAIVVRENIFRHMEMGKSPRQAALDGTKEVAMAVVATTAAILAVFGPFAFMTGTVGQYFIEFGNTVCFVMIISFLDAMAMAPMLSSYFGRGIEKKSTNSFFDRTFGRVAQWFQALLSKVLKYYEKLLGFSIRRPVLLLVLSFSVFAISLALFPFIHKTFIPAGDTGQFSVQLNMPPGTNLNQTAKVAGEIGKTLRAFKEVKTTVLTVGTDYSEDNLASFFVQMVDKPNVTTEDFKETVRTALKKYSQANPIVEDAASVGGGGPDQPLTIHLLGENADTLSKYAQKVTDALTKNQYLIDVNNSDEGDTPLVDVVYDADKLTKLGVLTEQAGAELYGQVEGYNPTDYWIGDEIYDLYVMLQFDQQNLQENFSKIFVPNMNNKIIKLENIAKLVSKKGPMVIKRQDRMRKVEIAASLTPKNPGLGTIMKGLKSQFKSTLKPPSGIQITYEGQSAYFQELTNDIIMAAAFALVFIYFVLASLYNSFTIPLTIMFIIPLATSGAFISLLVTGKSLDVFSMIACIVLMGLATKNSIVLVDFINQLLAKGKSLNDAIFIAGKERFRPIVMTSLALSAGMLPVAIGMSAISAQRSSMGVSIIGGVVSSTLLTLLVVPAALVLMEKVKGWRQKN